MNPIQSIKEFGSDIYNRFNQKKELKNAIIKITEQLKREHTLFRQEIKEWKMARISALDADIPRRTLLMHLYNDIMNDAFIWGRFENRKLRISNKQISVINGNGEIDEDKTKLLQKEWFNRFVKYVIESKAYGYSLPYVNELTDEGYIKSLKLIYRTHIVPETCEILKNTHDQRGVKYNEPPLAEWCMFIGDTDFLGLLDKAAPLYIFKKHSWQNWDEFEEMFGVPMRIAKTASQDPQVQKQLQKWLETLGSAAYAIFPENTEVDIKESNQRDAFNVFNEKRKACNEELAILIDGNFETSSETGSRAKATEVIGTTQKEITLDDATFTLFTINELLLPFLINRGYPFNEDDQVIWNDNPKLTPLQRLDIFKGVKDLGYKVKKEQIETELDVEIEEIEPVKDPPPDPNNSHPVNFEQPHSHDGCGAHLDTYRVIDFNIVNQLTDDEKELLRRLWNERGSINWDYNEFKKTHGKLLEALRSGYGNIDFDFEAPDHLTMEFFQSNVHRFGVDKTQKEIYDLNEILKSSDNFNDFRKRALKVFPNYKGSWLQAEFNQAHATSQAAARYKRYMDNADIAPFWQYKAVLDDRVRPWHRKLHNKVFRKNDPSSFQFLPPNGWNCRCDDIELIDHNGNLSSLQDAISADPDGYDLMKKSGHAVNWGNSKQVFTATQSYLSDLPIGKIDVKDFAFNVFALKAFKDVLNTNKIGTGKFNFKKHTDRSGAARFEDPQGLPVWLTEELSDTFNDDIKHTLPEVIRNPDEIYWSEQNQGFVKSYFKHYKDSSLNALVFIGKKERASITSFIKHQDPDSFRKGLLIYTPAEHIERRLVQYSELDKNYKKEHFNQTNGGFLAIHKNHGLNEVKANTIIGQKLSNIGKSVVLVENPITVKSYDALVNGAKWEFKTLSKYTNLKRRVNKALYQGSLQSDSILLYITNKYTISDLYNGIKGSVMQDSKRRIQFISLLFNDGRLITFSRKQVLSGEFITLIKK